ncbi:MAG TPA: hypothetical protein VLT45_25905 [Kofleriaceae bacterium]|nr:hypothetical protein [Kofleriaceae bacterium]
MLQLAALPSNAGPAPAPPKSLPECRVINNADHTVKLYDGLTVGEWRRFQGTQTIVDGAQTLALVCDAEGRVMKLVGTTGALGVEPLPIWFAAWDDGVGTFWVEAKKGTKVEVDGNAVELGRRGLATVSIDLRARLLASDLATIFDAPTQTWSILVAVKMTLGKETAEAMIRTEPHAAVRALLSELAAAGNKPVSWAGPPDPTGPAMIVGCERTTRSRVPRFDVVRSPARLTDISLVASCARTFVKLETCPKPQGEKYWHGDAVARGRLDGVITVVEARTGKVVATTTLPGGDPAACHDAAVETIAGAAPSVSAIESWLRTIH